LRLAFMPMLIAALAIIGPASAWAEDLQPDADLAYDSIAAMRPTVSTIIVCHGFGCRRRTEIGLSAGDRATLASILRGGHNSPAAERRAIATAVAWFDRRVGPEAGTIRHVARAGHDQMDDPDEQFDCIDASRNTTSLLQVLDELHLLKYHSIEAIEARGSFIDGRWPHATAVVTDVKTNIKWAVDSWTHAYGEKPDVKPLAVWLKEGGL
jgi:hypothetical protein